MDGQNTGHRPTVKGGYAPVAPIDCGQDLRSAMVNVLEELGIEVEVHHAEVGTGSQMEIGTRFATLVKRADQTQDMKYVIQNVAHNFGKTATFMPNPSWATTAAVCTFTNPFGKTVKTCSQATAMPVCLIPPFITSAASSNTPKP